VETQPYGDGSGISEGVTILVHGLLDAALAGLDQSKMVTIPVLEDKSEWDAYDAARRAEANKLSRTHPVPRYNVGGEEAHRAS